MKIVINTCYGGFRIKPEIVKKYGFDNQQLFDYRTDEKLIKLIESGVDCAGMCSELSVVEIPDEATDYHITDYDGAESVLYVLNGKIHFL